ncbi:hypothetical protein Zmor_014478 [Zophobas morio]|uniref:Uncharacterized protein n=1 Tax=Zophobas morio TaxID=2755281 RepID=A0AA38MGW4_9CUCU|nr:hypothetical protein Zmor_014478 [Zophobas morio]
MLREKEWPNITVEKIWKQVGGSKRGKRPGRNGLLCNTPLMYAARGNHPHSCQELLLHGGDFKLHNLNGDTAHTVAVENNSTLAQAVITNFIISQLEPSS